LDVELHETRKQQKRFTFLQSETEQESNGKKVTHLDKKYM